MKEWVFHGWFPISQKKPQLWNSVLGWSVKVTKIACGPNFEVFQAKNFAAKHICLWNWALIAPGTKWQKLQSLPQYHRLLIICQHVAWYAAFYWAPELVFTVITTSILSQTRRHTLWSMSWETAAPSMHLQFTSRKKKNSERQSYPR